MKTWRDTKRKCKECGKNFAPKKSNNWFCSRPCTTAYHNTHGRTTRLPAKPCQRCGKEFNPRGHSNLFCSYDCKAEHDNLKRRRAKQDHPASADLTEQEMIERLQALGHRVSIDKPQERTLKLAPKKVTHHRFGIVSDTHMGSKYQQLTYLHEFYDICAKEKIETVLHVGDLVHGSQKMHRDAILETFVHGADAQVDYAVENYPKRQGVRTLLIAGNHDTSHWEDSGSDVVSHFCEKRDDCTYLGQRGAFIEMGGAKIYLWHPRGGGSYALSYRLQKWIEQVAPDQKPHMVLVGHWHSPVWIPAYRNVEAIRLPCYQSQTPFEKTLGLHPTVGGLILDMQTSDKGIEDITARWVIRRVPLKADY